MVMQFSEKYAGLQTAKLELLFSLHRYITLIYAGLQYSIITWFMDSASFFSRDQGYWQQTADQSSATQRNTTSDCRRGNILGLIAAGLIQTV